MKNKGKIEDKIKEYFQGKEGIIAVYLFGSLTGGSFGAKKTPDIDVAVLLAKNHPYPDTLEAKIKIERGLEEFMGRQFGEVDLSILNDAPPVFVHEVLKCRHLVFEEDKEKRLDFELKAELKYFDTKPMREYFWKEMVKRVKERRFGYPE